MLKNELYLRNVRFECFKEMGSCHILTKASGVLERVKQLASAKGASLCKRGASLWKRHISRQKGKERNRTHKNAKDFVSKSNACHAD